MLNKATKPVSGLRVDWIVMPMNELDVEKWIDDLASQLKSAFGERLRFVGIQGSRARNEAKPTSDIDSVVVIDDLSVSDIDVYRSIIARMPESELACGFIGSPDVLASWSRYDAFSLVMDTKPVLGTLDFMGAEFSQADALLSAKVGAGEIYHALCHGLAFDPANSSEVLRACIKSSFFVMRSLTYARTGEYPSSRKRMKELASSEEARFLDAYDADAWDDKLAEDLLVWSSEVLKDTQIG